MVLFLDQVVLDSFVFLMPFASWVRKVVLGFAKLFQVVLGCFLSCTVV